MKRQSVIFTEKQMHSIQKRMDGNKKDDSGTYAKLKPKLKEIYGFWINQEEIKKMVMGG